MGMALPHLYFDTNVILDVIEERWPPSVSLAERAKAEGWSCSTSRFTVLEMLDAKQEDRFMRNLLNQGFTLSQIVRRLGGRRGGKFSLGQVELDAIYEELSGALSKRLGFIVFQRPLTELWDETEKLCADTNIAPADAIHLATALGAGCDVLVSRDSEFLAIAQSYIPTASPESINGVLKKLGFADRRRT